MFIAIPSFALLYSMDEVVVNPAITIKAIGHQWYRSAPLHEGDLSATKCLKNMVREASGLPHRSCETTRPGEDNLLFMLLFLRFGDGGPTVGNSRYKQLDRRGPALLLFHRGAVRSEKQEMSSDKQSLTFDSYTIPENDLELGQLRLLEVDNRVVVPAKSHLHIIVTSANVLHSWVVPSLGVKCDAVPGRLNQISISVQREGVYYGQCSEIYGTNHAFMRAPKKIEPERLASEWLCEGGQSKIILFLYKDNRRSQRLGATIFLSYSSFFMISCRDEQTKQKRGPSQRKEKDLQWQRLLTLFLFLVVFYQSRKPPQRDPQNRIEKGGQGSRKSLPSLPGQDRWEGALSRP
ncbi:cytochrome c oxidase subunit 2 [Tanacetum coccineum]|uniref:cytochrome-c oxidase n=1 Tax=Tanacetum coccineum TaxID=301880 RepID=A0ABQ5HB35_9ASTR